MTNQKLSTLTQNEIPEKFREKFLLKRIDEDDIEITLEQRNIILKALENGSRFVQIKKHTLMLNALKSIDPKYPPYNIPPRPREITETVEIVKGKNGYETAVQEVKNKKEILLWDYLFGGRLEEYYKQLNKDEIQWIKLPIAKGEDSFESLEQEITKNYLELQAKDENEIVSAKK